VGANVKSSIEIYFKSSYLIEYVGIKQMRR